MTNNSLPFFIIQETYNVQNRMSWEKMAKCMKNKPCAQQTTWHNEHTKDKQQQKKDKQTTQTKVKMMLEKCNLEFFFEKTWQPCKTKSEQEIVMKHWWITTS